MRRIIWNIFNVLYYLHSCVKVRVRYFNKVFIKYFFSVLGVKIMQKIMCKHALKMHLRELRFYTVFLSKIVCWLFQNCTWCFTWESGGNPTALECCRYWVNAFCYFILYRKMVSWTICVGVHRFPVKLV